ncbi:MAG TPA: undecaprenyldiphospho-muramoylpentapeptide beta-N-acetylglucosaminyltransferase, partial [Beijerinckiaceae bacterium]|nr:undecaprenyldiphospho-muramoylpentapeptide beta-N-acetylglucosaminyltransferase [Beijerinckiaceae bacterium]
MTGPLRVVLAAGGTGGHLFPAEALANVLIARGAEVDLVSDDRAAAFAASFPAKLHVVKAGTVTGSGLVAKIRGALALLGGTRQALGLMSRLRPDVVVGFGGYPTVPPVYAATIRGIPTIIHEANGVMGRANRLLSSRVTRIATGVPLKDLRFPDKTVVTGSPVRPPVLAAAEVPFASPAQGGRLGLMVFGGSQGARVMGEVVPPALAMLPELLRGRIDLVQQVRSEDLDKVANAYRLMGVTADLAPFFKDLPARMAGAHLVISRSGASTVAELAVIGRPSILVPLPGSIDQDQATNARQLAEAGAALVCPQADFTPEWLAGEIARMMAEPRALADMAARARALAAGGRPDVRS